MDYQHKKKQDMNDFPYYTHSFQMIMVNVAVSLDEVLEYYCFEKKRIEVAVCSN